MLRGILEGTHTPLVLDAFELLFGALSPITGVGGLTLIYYVTPNTHLRLRSALAGGLVAGAAWSMARHVYTGAAEYSFRNNPLYASLGALPMFLAWLYVDWLIFLVGARLSYAVEHATFRDSLWAFGAHPRARELVAARLAQETTLVWSDGGRLPCPGTWPCACGSPESLVHEVVERHGARRLLQRHRQRRAATRAAPRRADPGGPTLAVHGVDIPGGPETWTGPRAPGFERWRPSSRRRTAPGLEVLRRTSGWTSSSTCVPGCACPAGAG